MISYILFIFDLTSKKKRYKSRHCTRHSTCPFFCQHSIWPIRWWHCVYR